MAARAMCIYHQEKRATAMCWQCHEYICEECVAVTSQGKVYCKKCFEKMNSKQHTLETVTDPASQQPINSNSKTMEQIPEKFGPSIKQGKIIKETKCYCSACGNLWYFGKQDELESAGNAMSNVGKEMMCCTGCVPAAFLPDKKVIHLDKCPKCGSSAITKEIVTHVV
jgi:hypothetical protein